MTNIKNKLLIDTRLNEEEMNFLWSAIFQEPKTLYNSELAGNISKSELIQDKDNWFYKTVLKKLTDKMFYREDNNYYKYHVTNSHGCPHTYNMITYTSNVSYAIHIHIIHKHTYIVIKLLLYIIYFYVITSYTFYQTSSKARCMKCRGSDLKLVSNIL